MPIVSRTSTNWQLGSYQADRNEEIKRVENDPLRVTGTDVGVDIVGGNITVGYGWDIDVQSLAGTQTNFALAGIQLTQDQDTVLTGYKNNVSVAFTVNGQSVTRVPTQADFVDVWSTFTMSDVGATSLLNTVIGTWETGLSGALGADDLPQSTERAALISLLYNTTSGTANSISAFAPTTIGLIQQNPTAQKDIFLQRAEVWFEIVYGTNAIRPNDMLEIGLQNRREGEGELFGLYTEDDPAGGRMPSTVDDYLESKTVIRFLDQKNAGNALISYYTARHFSQATAESRINSQYEEARKQLISVFYTPDITANVANVAVTVAATNAQGVLTIEQFGQDVTPNKNLVFGSDLADQISVGDEVDAVFAGGGDDFVDGGIDDDDLYGGNNNDTLVGGEGDDLLHGGDSIAGLPEGVGDGIDTVDYSVSGAAQGQGITVTVSPNTTPSGSPIILVTDPFGDIDTLISIESIIGTAEVDTVDLAALTAVGVAFDGGGGDDNLQGGAGNDSLYGGEGADTVIGGAGDDILGNIHAPTFDYTLLTTTEIDAIVASENTAPVGGESSGNLATILDGGAGNDIYLIDYSSDFSATASHGATNFIIEDIDPGTKIFVRDMATGVIDALGGQLVTQLLTRPAFQVVLDNDGTPVTCTIPAAIWKAYGYLGETGAFYLVGYDDPGASDAQIVGGACVIETGISPEPFDPDAIFSMTRFDSIADLIAAGFESEDGAPLGVPAAGNTLSIHASLNSPNPLSIRDIGIGALEDLGLQANQQNSNTPPSASGGVSIQNQGAVTQIAGTAGNDYAYSTTGKQIASLGAGDDYVVTGSGNDVVNGEGGDDVLRTTGGNDLLTGGAGADGLDGGAGIDTADYSSSNAAVTVNLAGVGVGGDAEGDYYVSIEGVIGSGFADTLLGDGKSNILAGGAGADSLDGGAGSDDYMFSAGFGADLITDAAILGDIDRIVFDETITLVDISLTVDLVDSNDLVVTHAASSSSITVDGFFLNDGSGIEEIAFSNGVTLDHARIVALTTLVRDSNQTINGTSGDDTITGGTGHDTLRGNEGSDTYIQVANHGNDKIDEFGLAAAIDRIVFDASIAPGDIRLEKNSASLNDLFLINDITGDIIEVDQHFLAAATGIEEIVFSGGTIWDPAFIVANVTMVGTSASETLTGNTDDERIRGGLGDDTLPGKEGSDDYLFAAGDGNDKIDEFGLAGDTDRIVFDAGIAPGDIRLEKNSATLNDLFLINDITGDIIEVDQHFLAAATGIEEIVFSDGTIWGPAFIVANVTMVGTSASETLTGNNDDERIRGGLGDDTMPGKAGSDDYLFAAGDGNDKIIEFGLAGDTDRIVFDAGIATGDIELRKTTAGLNDLILVNNVTGEQIEVDQHFKATIHGVEEIVFADGTIWDQAFIVANVTMVGTSAGELLIGNTDDERIRGGLGDDSLLGKEGSDDYLFGANDGADLVDEFGLSTDVDRIIFDAGIAPTDVLLSRGVTNTNTVIITNVNTGATITIDQQRSSTTLGIEEIHFADGTIWDRAQIETLSNTAPPIIIDLDGDGVELISLGVSHTRFDFDGDGVRERGGWVGPDDGLLVLDRNGDGRIAGVSEISFLGDLNGARSDLEGLGGFDSDGDGALTAADDMFGEFLVWQDRNSNGKSERNELMRLSELGIIAIDPVGTAPIDAAPVSLTDNTILGGASVLWADGHTTDLADVALRYAENGHNDFEGELAALREQLANARDAREEWHHDDHERHGGFQNREAHEFRSILDAMRALLAEERAAQEADNRDALPESGPLADDVETPAVDGPPQIGELSEESVSSAESANNEDPASVPAEAASEEVQPENGSETSGEERVIEDGPPPATETPDKAPEAVSTSDDPLDETETFTIEETPESVQFNFENIETLDAPMTPEFPDIPVFSLPVLFDHGGFGEYIAELALDDPFFGSLDNPDAGALETYTEFKELAPIG